MDIHDCAGLGRADEVSDEEDGVVNGTGPYSRIGWSSRVEVDSEGLAEVLGHHSMEADDLGLHTS